ncbi:hypothetical protein ACRDU6_22940 [Mycolicibacterium sp. ELW1]|uniref:hypothetical protein n=1 Tax=Mycobacteriaceae TaxID=1762 RepID=UPI0011ED0913|nr:hypothetical protein [Mycobacterium sp. ELW1]QEN15165.1 hypothetical protein D3H54_19490 [Mycobacterium sp. ELW1]
MDLGTVFFARTGRCPTDGRAAGAATEPVELGADDPVSACAAADNVTAAAPKATVSAPAHPM